MQHTICFTSIFSITLDIPELFSLQSSPLSCPLPLLQSLFNYDQDQFLMCEKEEPQDRLSAGFCESCNEHYKNTRIKFRNKAKRRRESNVMR